MRVSRTKARRGAAGGLRNHGLLSLANGPFQGSQNADLRRAPQDLDRQNSKVCPPREGESAMKKGPDADVPPTGPSTGQQQTPLDPFGDMAEAWKGAMAPWLAWFGAAESATRSRATKLGTAAAQALTRPDKMLESMSSLSG